MLRSKLHYVIFRTKCLHTLNAGITRVWSVRGSASHARVGLDMFSWDPAAKLAAAAEGEPGGYCVSSG